MLAENGVKTCSSRLPLGLTRCPCILRVFMFRGSKLILSNYMPRSLVIMNAVPKNETEVTMQVQRNQPHTTHNKVTEYSIIL